MTQQHDNPIEALMRAIEWFGTQEAMAEKLGLHQSNISAALNGNRKLSVQNAVLIDNATVGEVTKEELRPDIFRVG